MRGRAARWPPKQHWRRDGHAVAAAVSMDCAGRARGSNVRCRALPAVHANCALPNRRDCGRSPYSSQRLGSMRNADRASPGVGAPSGACGLPESVAAGSRVASRRRPVVDRTEKGAFHVVHDSSGPGHPVASRTRNLLHGWRVHPCPAGDRHHHDSRQLHQRATYVVMRSGERNATSSRGGSLLDAAAPRTRVSRSRPKHAAGWACARLSDFRPRDANPGARTGVARRSEVPIESE